jgi:membrane protein implicated in regulation of membrane protease activity
MPVSVSSLGLLKIRKDYISMFSFFRRNLASENVYLRIATTCFLFVVIFFTITTISYFLLPEGILRSKNPAQNWDTSDNLLVSTLQIFLFNQLSVVMILIGNTFSSRKNSEQNYLPIGYLAFFTQILINAVTLGTWSFSVVTEAVPLLDRIMGTFDILHKGGLWEMSGQLLILCATAKISIIMTDGNKTSVRSWKEVILSKQEVFIFFGGLLIMLTGAFIESFSIMSLNNIQ